MVTDQTIEIVTYKSLAYICEKRVSAEDDQAAAWERRAAKYHRLASRAVRGYRPTLDTNSDGYPDIAFNLGVFTFR